MKPLKIDCANENWKSLLKRNLQDGIEATLDNFDYTADGQFCELLAVSHSMNFRLDVRNKVGHFTRTSVGAIGAREMHLHGPYHRTAGCNASNGIAALN